MTNKAEVKESVLPYDNVGTCLVCGCDMPGGKCATVTLMEPYDQAAAVQLREQGYEIESEVGSYFDLQNLPLVKAAQERKAAQEAAKKASTVSTKISGSSAVAFTYNGSKKEGFRTESHKFKIPAYQMALYVLKYMYPSVEMSHLKDEELNQIIRNYDMDMTPSEVRKRYHMNGVDNDGNLLFGVMIGPEKKGEGYSQSTWSFEIKDRRFIIRNVFSDKSGFATTEWVFPILS